MNPLESFGRRWISRVSATVLTCLVALTITACSDDGSGTTDAGNTPDIVDIADETRAQQEWADTLYRIELIDIIQPVGIGDVLEGIIQLEINRRSSELLIETYDFSVTTGEASFKVRAGAGEVVGTETFAFVGEPPAPGNATVLADGSFTTDEPILLDFPVLLRIDPRCDGGVCPDGMCRDDNDCPVDGSFECDSEDSGQCLQFIIVPLNDLTFEGEFETEDGTAVLRGTDLAGAILKTDADEIFIEIAAGGDPASLTSLLQEGRMDYPEGSENPTGWKLTLVLNATEVAPVE